MLGVGLGWSSAAAPRPAAPTSSARSSTAGPACPWHRIMLIDFFIISASGLAFRKLEAPLYGYIVLFISSGHRHDLEGWNYTKMVIITPRRPRRSRTSSSTPGPRRHGAEVAHALPQPRGRDHHHRHPPQAAGRAQAVHQVGDEGAFVIINDTYAVLGKGFKATQVS